MSQGERAECRRGSSGGGAVRRGGDRSWAERRKSRGGLGQEMGPSGKEALSWG